MTFNCCELGLWSRPDAMSGAPQGFSGVFFKKQVTSITIACLNPQNLPSNELDVINMDMKFLNSDAILNSHYAC